MSCNFGLKSYLCFQIELALRARSILKSRVWLQHKLLSTQFNYHYLSPWKGGPGPGPGPGQGDFEENTRGTEKSVANEGHQSLFIAWEGEGGRGGVGELWGELRGNREVYSKWGAPVIIHRQGGGLRSRKTMRRTQGEQRSQKQIRGKGHYLSPGRGWGGVGGLEGGALEYYRDSWKGSGKYEKLWCSDPRPAINNDRSLVSRKGPFSDTCVACVQN